MKSSIFLFTFLPLCNSYLLFSQSNTVCIEINALLLYRKLQQLKAENFSIIGFETDHRFGNVLNEVTVSIINWIKDHKNNTL
jgi:hypothetical protein